MLWSCYTLNTLRSFTMETWQCIFRCIFGDVWGFQSSSGACMPLTSLPIAEQRVYELFLEGQSHAGLQFEHLTRGQTEEGVTRSCLAAEMVWCRHSNLPWLHALGTCKNLNSFVIYLLTRPTCLPQGMALTCTWSLSYLTRHGLYHSLPQLCLCSKACKLYVSKQWMMATWLNTQGSSGTFLVYWVLREDSAFTYYLRKLLP